MIRKLKEIDFKTSTWSGGQTTQLYIYPENSNYTERNFRFRISSATVELEKSEFTKLVGVHRFITPLDNHLKLTHDCENFISLEPFEVYEFEGDLNTTSYGKAKDFNLMLANGAKGDLRNFYVEHNTEISIMANCSFNILFSFDNLFRICIEAEEFLLSPNEILVIKSDTPATIKIHSEKSANILLSRIRN